MTKEIFQQITTWQAATFPLATPMGMCIHLVSEVKELIEEINPLPGDGFRHEIADCFIFLQGIAFKKGMSYEDIVSVITNQWQVNDLAVTTAIEITNKLQDEVMKMKDGINGDGFRAKCADCFILLWMIASVMGMDYGNICNAVNEKMAINIKRNWGSPDANGMIRHIHVSGLPRANDMKPDVIVIDDVGEETLINFCMKYPFLKY